MEDPTLEEPDHTHRAHAVLSASSSKQWLHCPPSVRLQEGFPDVSSVYAEEGTFAHEMCEYKAKGYLGEQIKRPESDEFYSQEIEDATSVYYEFVVSIVEKMRSTGCEPLVLVEERVDYSHIAPGGFGTADMLIIGKDEDGTGVLHIVDYKNGQGVFVDADHNSQMMLYAIGGLHGYGYIYPIDIVRMTIVQPRLDNISTCECSRQELEAWGESIKPIARLAYEGKGEQKAGDWCRFCRAKPLCRACKEEALALCREEFMDLEASREVKNEAEDAAGDDLTDAYTPDTTTPVFKMPGLVPLAELAEIMPTLSRISSWIESVFAYVSSEAVVNAVEVPGYKVVEGRSKRVFTDTDAVVQVATDNGYTDLYKTTLKTLTDFEKMMGKKKFNELLGEYVAKPRGKLTLVPATDPRPAVNVNEQPDHEFEVIFE